MFNAFNFFMLYSPAQHLVLVFFQAQIVLNTGLQKNNCHYNLNPGQVFVAVGSILACWFYLPSSAMISFKSTENIFPGTRTQDSFRRCGCRFCNLLVETTNFGLGAVFLSCLVFEPQKSPSLGLEPRTLFSEILSLWSLLLVSGHKHAKCGANLFIPSRALSEHTYTHSQIVV
jgi:hypothetical protein